MGSFKQQDFMSFHFSGVFCVGLSYLIGYERCNFAKSTALPLFLIPVLHASD